MKRFLKSWEIWVKWLSWLEFRVLGFFFIFVLDYLGGFRFKFFLYVNNLILILKDIVEYRGD